ncbi:1-deoxy-D-xylulose-5-phosphate synthase [Acidobacteria bacterium AH-259-D05]|nr:1-deoxy-D-xylulose-5-phosphate synthase [Acidobacteria bacterium AH-259-D05]
MGEVKGKFIIGMRDAFFDELYSIAQKDRDLIIISADNGAPSLDKFSDNLTGQFFQVGIAEALMAGMASGMAFEGKKVYAYAIAPFVTTRIHEQVKLDLCAMNLPIVLLGVGAGYGYDIMGPSHHTVEDISIMRALPNLKIHSPADGTCAASLAHISYEDPSPQYIRFDRAGIADLYKDKTVDDFRSGLIRAKEGSDLYIVATGIMVHQALKVAEELAKTNIDAGVIDVHRIKPLNQDLLFEYLGNVARVVTLEEHLLSGGLGSILAEMFVDAGITTPLLRIGQEDRFVFDYGGRSVIWEKYGLDVVAVNDKIQKWMERTSVRARMLARISHTPSTALAQ